MCWINALGICARPERASSARRPIPGRRARRGFLLTYARPRVTSIAQISPYLYLSLRFVALLLHSRSKLYYPVSPGLCSILHFDLNLSNWVITYSSSGPIKSPTWSARVNVSDLWIPHVRALEHLICVKFSYYWPCLPIPLVCIWYWYTRGLESWATFCLHLLSFT